MGINITSCSNTIEEVCIGVTLNLQGADVGNSLYITVEADTELLAENIQNVVTY